MAKKVTLSSVSLIFACGTALFSDGYANNVIGSGSMTITVLKRIYGTGSGGITTNYSTTLSSVAFAGIVVGMFTFGYLSDKAGRKFGMMSATGIIAVFSGLSSASSGVNHNLNGMLAMLIACRFFLGIGVGAEYPCGSVSASEQSEEEGIAKNSQHQWLVLATTTMIDFGFVIGACVPLVLYWIFGDNHLRAVWRLSVGLGVVPAAGVFFWRLHMEEPNRYKRDSMKHVRIPYGLVIKRYWRGLLGISLVWFIYDFVTYPFGLYSSTITDTITGGSSSLAVVLGWSAVINLFYMPGTIIGAFVVDRMGPKVTMITGLLVQAVIGFIMSGFYTQLSQHVAAFAVVYGIFLSFGEFGAWGCAIPPSFKLFLPRSRKLRWCSGCKVWTYCCAWPVLRCCSCCWKNRRICWNLVTDFGGSGSTKGNTGPFWVASGLGILSAIIVYFLVTPLDHDGMREEDAKVRSYPSRYPRHLHTLQRSSVNTSKRMVLTSHLWVFAKLKPCNIWKAKGQVQRSRLLTQRPKFSCAANI
ncbi:major facilitator superfamily domain-containing protein [Suillus bovinus]|uniref:major facilitator superfamily domain-containing protein n=1 Tax=Suillus bovinus TaxID=48563 RepID=UPI001B86FDB8|nr:major facilitator superfamily domain-containing protein [Suillus bovinus]KAG2132689.1 major facilitator superfamily domain-containing protein [Suillus bovinus]